MEIITIDDKIHCGKQSWLTSKSISCPQEGRYSVCVCLGLVNGAYDESHEDSGEDNRGESNRKR